MNEKATTIIEAAKSALGYPYVFGMWGRDCSTENRRNYASYNPSHKSWIYSHCPVLSGKQKSCSGCEHEGQKAFDCRGFTYWCCSKAGIKIEGSGCTAQYTTNSNWKAKGKIADMPNIVCLVFMYYNSKYQHTGVHIGDGVIIHCAYDDNGVQYGSVTGDSRWSHYAIPKGLYTDAEIKAAGIYDPNATTTTTPSTPTEEQKGEWTYQVSGLTEDVARALITIFGGKAAKAK